MLSTNRLTAPVLRNSSSATPVQTGLTADQQKPHGWQKTLLAVWFVFLVYIDHSTTKYITFMRVFGYYMNAAQGIHIYLSA